MQINICQTCTRTWGTVATSWLAGPGPVFQSVSNGSHCSMAHPGAPSEGCRGNTILRKSGISGCQGFKGVTIVRASICLNFRIFKCADVTAVPRSLEGLGRISGKWPMDLSFIPAVSSSHLGSSTPPPTQQLFIIDLLHRVSVGGEPGGPVYSPPYTPLFCSEQKFIVALV